MNEQILGQTSAISTQFWADARMPYVESRRACNSRVCYKSHSHSTFSIGAVDVGESVFSSVFAPAQNIQQGSIVVIPAHVEHCCNPVPNQAWSYQMLHLDAQWLNQLLDEFYAAQSQIAVPRWQPEIFQIPEVYQNYCQLNQTLFDKEKLIFEKEQVLIECLTRILLPHFNWQRIPQAEYGVGLLNRLLEQCHDASAFLSLQQLAQSVGISRYSVIRLFKNHVGVTPHVFQLNLKIQQGRVLLKQGREIIDIAQTLGFHDQSHFHKVFKQLTGITPKQYQTGFSRNFVQD
ncbi:MAG: AraC family transcriptional regulator [Acinetobacter sp.]